MPDQPAQRAPQPDGSVVDYDASGHALRQTWPDGRITTFHYRGDDYVATTGDEHVLYDSGGHEIKQWQGSDESSALSYHSLGHGRYSLTDPSGAVSEYQSNGHLSRQTTPDGQVATFQYRGEDYVATTGDEHVLYAANGTEVKQWQGSDESSASAYHGLGNGHYSLTDPKGTVTEYAGDGDLVRQTAPDGQVTTFQYRGEDYVATTGDEHVLYDGGGHEVKQWQGSDESSALAYHALGNGDYTLTDPKGVVTEYRRDGHLVEQVDGGHVTTFRYRGDDYVATTGDEHVLYDASGHEVKQWEGADESAAQLYHPLANGDYTLTDQKGTVTEYTSAGRLVRQTGPGDQVTTFEYRGENYVATTGDEHVLYDARGNEVKQWQGNDESSAQAYHGLGNGHYTLTDPKGTVTEYTRDGHLVQQTRPGHQVTTFQYRGDDYVATTGDEHVLYDAKGNEVKQWQGNDESTAQTYHPLAGGHYTLTDPKGVVTEYTGDGHLVRQNSDGTVTTFQYRGNNYVATTGDHHVLYDGDGNEIKQWQGNDESTALTYHGLGGGHYTLTDPKGTVTEYTGDGHLVQQRKSDGTLTTFQYRGNNYVATTGDHHVLYDGDGNEIKQWQGNDESTAKTYHGLGNGHYTLTDPDGTVTEYNGKDQPILVTKPGQPPETIQWLSNGDYIVTQGDQHSRYNGKGQLLETWTGGDESLADHYTYKSNGDLVITGADGSTTEYGPDGKPIWTTEPDGTKINWKVDLEALHNAITAVQAERDGLETDLKSVDGVFTNIQDNWKSPAGTSFGLLSTDFHKATRDLTDALDEALSRMRSSYKNYVDSEAKNSSIIAQINKEGHKLAGQTGGGA
ncbi:MAG TPA: WXG100 family type VII secretion target [Actinocatenispora sp.]